VPGGNQGQRSRGAAASARGLSRVKKEEPADPDAESQT
jgi:hypothetical protein